MKFENTAVWGFEHALRGMRNPLESWDKSDSCNDYVGALKGYAENHYVIGENDMNLCKRLISGGSEHRKFLRQVFVSVDITAPLYWWKEFDTYKVGTVANSTSTMHKLATTPITIDCFETDDYDGNFTVKYLKAPVDSDLGGEISFDMDGLFDAICFYLEILRNKYLETHDKRYWKELVRWLPEGWLQTRTVTLNYENLLTIYHQRKSHKLNEWSGKDDNTKPNFIAWMLDLPYMRDFVVAEEES